MFGNFREPLRLRLAAAVHARARKPTKPFNVLKFKHARRVRPCGRVRVYR
jgi:hypothetical protein